jgi:CRP-like cAMP-binding protein
MMNHQHRHVLEVPRQRPWVQLPTNTLLAELAATPTFARLRPRLTAIHFEQGELVHDFSRPPSYVYFPTTAVVSLCRATADGCTSELAAVGREGMIGISVLTGGETSASQAVVISPGAAWRVPADVLKHEFSSTPACQALFLRYLHALLMDIFHRMTCNTHHRIRQRLCRLLLQMHDWSATDELMATHEMIANRLGVRRESISEVAQTLQGENLIRNRRGRIRIMDRSGLEERSCECYGLIKEEYERLFGSDN